MSWNASAFRNGSSQTGNANGMHQKKLKNYDSLKTYLNNILKLSPKPLALPELLGDISSNIVLKEVSPNPLRRADCLGHTEEPSKL